MGYVPMTCHICEGPADCSPDQLEDDLPDDQGGLPEVVRSGLTRWLCDMLGITESAGPSAVGQIGLAASVPVEDNVPLALCAWDGLAGYDLRDDKQKGFTPFDLEGRLVGLVCHAACYTLLAQQLRYRLKLRDVQQLAKNKWQALLMQGDYGGMLHHQDQDFDYARLDSEGKFWMVEDPAVCERNAQRILDTWRPFTQPIVDEVKDKERRLRRGPCTAVFCSFRSASALAAERGGSSEGSDGVNRLWKAMAAFPAELVVIIVTLADLAYIRDMADAVI